MLFLTLNTFSATGGIERLCRVVGKALYENAKEKGEAFTLYSLYDGRMPEGHDYFPREAFRGFGGQKLRFTLASVRKGPQVDTVVISHINLLPIAYLIKKASPKTRLVAFAHGVEVWQKMPGLKTSMLRAVDLFLPVSRYTAAKLQSVHGICPNRMRVVNNCLDPFLERQQFPAIEAQLRERHQLSAADTILLTVSRLKHSEQYKGYDKVIRALKTVQQTVPSVKYLIVGRYDKEEKKRLDDLVTANGVADRVIFAGFAKDEELASYFNLADVYTMPSTGEGFGIVFIEAMFYGKPVIAGDKDGSADALADGELGLLVNPNRVDSIAESIIKVCQNKEAYRPNADHLQQRFGFASYKQNLAAALATDNAPQMATIDRLQQAAVTLPD